jgi:hypothetical protein
MERCEINPTDWLLGLNLNQGIEVTGGERTLFQPELMVELEATAVA